VHARQSRDSSLGARQRTIAPFTTVYESGVTVQRAHDIEGPLRTPFPREGNWDIECRDKGGKDRIRESAEWEGFQATRLRAAVLCHTPSARKKPGAQKRA